MKNKYSDFINKLLEKPCVDGGFALDLGCGVGRSTIAFAESGYRVDAVDIDKEALSKLEFENPPRVFNLPDNPAKCSEICKNRRVRFNSLVIRLPGL